MKIWLFILGIRKETAPNLSILSFSLMKRSRINLLTTWKVISEFCKGGHKILNHAYSFYIFPAISGSHVGETILSSERKTLVSYESHF